MSNESPSTSQQNISSTTESLPPPPNHESDSMMTASATTVFDSGRSDDSGASVSRRLDGYLNEFDNRVPDSKKPLHGKECVCLECITILNVDGNDSPDLSSSGESEDLSPATQASSQALAKAQVAVDDNEKVATRDRAAPSNGQHLADGLPHEPLPGPSRVTHWSHIPSASRENPKFPQKSKARVPTLNEVLATGSPHSNQSSMSNGDDAVDNFLASVEERKKTQAQTKAQDKDGLCDFLELSVNIEDLSDMTDSEDERYENRVRTGWFSDPATNTSCDSTDYSDEDDLRNFFIDGGRDECDRARTNAILGREPRPEHDDLSIALDDSDENEPDSNRSVSIFFPAEA